MGFCSSRRIDGGGCEASDMIIDWTGFLITELITKGFAVAGTATPPLDTGA